MSILDFSLLALDLWHLRFTFEQQRIVGEELVNQSSPLHSGRKWPRVPAIETAPYDGPTLAARALTDAPEIAFAVVTSGKVLKTTDTVVGRTPSIHD